MAGSNSTYLPNPYNIYNNYTLKCSDKDCAFQIAMIIFHNIASCGTHSIPQFIMNALKKYGRSGFKNCCAICESFSPAQIEEFWNTLHRVGKPSYFIHIDTDIKLTPKSHNAIILFNFNDDITSITKTALGIK